MRWWQWWWWVAGQPKSPLCLHLYYACCVEKRGKKNTPKKTFPCKLFSTTKNRMGVIWTRWCCFVMWFFFVLVVVFIVFHLLHFILSLYRTAIGENYLNSLQTHAFALFLKHSNSSIHFSLIHSFIHFYFYSSFSLNVLFQLNG